MLSEISAQMAAIVRLQAKPRLLTTNSLPSTDETRLTSGGRASLSTGAAECVGSRQMGGHLETEIVRYFTKFIRMIVFTSSIRFYMSFLHSMLTGGAIAFHDATRLVSGLKIKQMQEL